MAYGGRKSFLVGVLGWFAGVGHSGSTSMVEDVAGAASGSVGLVYPPASGVEPEYYGGLLRQSCGLSLRGPDQGGRADAGYPENLPAGVLAYSPLLKSLREIHTGRG